ncbi:alpha/beta fold hydrolase [Paenibacillus sp. y28]|uniref:alpha/beta fold hydrolase n=1 Tax=Paenibacillus sp. y28 TaxID=3129110 RepID=UPI00301829A5
MNIQSSFVRNGDTFIHYLDSGNRADPKLTPLVVCPGLSETAEEYADFINGLLPRRSIVLSFRGRGGSGTPPTGYDLDHHVSDVEQVVSSASLSRFHLFGYSRGVSYALGFAVKHFPQLRSLAVLDYPAEHKQMTPDWADDYIHNYLLPTGRTANIRIEAVRGIQRESVPVRFNSRLPIPMLVMRGLLKGSLLTDTDLEAYAQLQETFQKLDFTDSGHDVRNTEPAKLTKSVAAFLNECDRLFPS